MQETNGIRMDFPRGVAPYNFPIRGPREFVGDELEPTGERPTMGLPKPFVVTRVLGDRDKRHQKKER